jgi:pilus assembly protein TadC
VVNIIDTLVHLIKKGVPSLSSTLKKAAIEEEVDVFIKKRIIFSFFYAIFPTAFLLLVFLKEKFPLILLSVVFMIFFVMCLFVFLNLPSFSVTNRRVELESDLLYSARFLLLKLESGAPLYNALIDVSKLHTKSSKYFQELVTDISLGTPLEEAIDYAIKYCPSRAYGKILEEIRNSLKTGSDIEKSLNSTLSDITKEHIIQIKLYGRKLAPISMFYMIAGTIAPSLGTAMFVVASTFLNIRITFGILLFLVFGLAMLQGFFIIIFKAVKPQVMT